MDCATRSILAASFEVPVAETLLEIRGLKTWFKTDDGMVQAVDGVDLRIDRGETVGVVGESGCGKSVTGLSLLQLIDMLPGLFEDGKILWRGRDLIPLGDEAAAAPFAFATKSNCWPCPPVYRHAAGRNFLAS